MESLTAKLILLAFLLPAGAVFVVAYRHALHTWLLRPAVELPGAAIASHRAVLHGPGLVRRFHAAAIAIAFASVFIMGLIALAMVLIAIVASA
jgi:hypothetical protein